MLTKETIKVSVVIPCYNEVNTLESVIERVRDCGLSTEIILVDDCSTDGTRELIKESLYKKVDRVLFHKKNMGKGAALRHGFSVATGDVVIVQDADLEYDPKDFQKLVEPFVNGIKDADVVVPDMQEEPNTVWKVFTILWEIRCLHFCQISAAIYL